MKTAKDILGAICTIKNAIKAYNKARRGKRYRPEVLKFEQNREANLSKAIAEIKNGTYTAGRYYCFKVYEPKERLIMALPFHDRVVQHMIVNVIEPLFEKRFIFHSYACRKEKGVHEASDTLSKWLYNLQVRQGKKVYAIKADIHHYFQSIDHEILKAEVRRYISDKTLLKILDHIIDHNGIYPDGVGIPVGNLTSQLFANVYLNILDHYIKHVLHIRFYIRYMDDFVILGESPEELREILAKIEAFLQDRLKLSLNPKTTIICAKNGVDFVGYRHFPTFKIIRKGATRRIKKMLKAFETGEVDEELFDASMQSRIAAVEHADAWNLCAELREQVKEIKIITIGRFDCVICEQEERNTKQ